MSKFSQIFKKSNIILEIENLMIYVKIKQMVYYFHLKKYSSILSQPSTQGNIK